MLIRRALLASVIATLTVLGTTACNLTSPVASLTPYAPSDGIQTDLGAVKARNLIYFKAPNGKAAIYGAFVNSSSEKQELVLAYKNLTGSKTFRLFTLDPYEVLNLGYQNRSPLKADLAGNPGDLVQITLTVGDLDPEVLNVPVLDGILPEYRDLVDKLANS